jgi:hypothetical protein
MWSHETKKVCAAKESFNKINRQPAKIEERCLNLDDILN